VYGVATFYAQFRFKPLGKNRITVCRGTACHVRGSGRLVEELERELGIKAGDTTDDMLFSLQTVACLGSCALAPVVVINDKVYGKTTPKSVKKTLKKIEPAAPQWSKGAKAPETPPAEKTEKAAQAPAVKKVEKQKAVEKPVAEKPAKKKPAKKKATKKAARKKPAKKKPAKKKATKKAARKKAAKKKPAKKKATKKAARKKAAKKKPAKKKAAKKARKGRKK
jgi:hypothetical protein